MSDRYVQPLRILIQFSFFCLIIWLSFRFFQFVQYFRSNGTTAYAARPDGIEAFLPISGLLGLSAWFKGMGINPIHPAALVLFLTILVTSLLLRRSFCSFICPVATISECSWKTGYKVLHRNFRAPAWLDLILRAVKYMLLAFFLYSISFAMSPAELRDFIMSDYHRVADVRLLDFFLNLTPFALGIIILLIITSLLLKNPFCRYLCPYGALLGLLAMLSPLRVTRNIERCVSCGACSAVCPSYLDVMHKKSVISPECIGCWRCISHCRADGALSMRFFGRTAVSGILFVFLVLLVFWGGRAVGIQTGHWKTSLDSAEYSRLLGR
ncbi:MAG: 4Fe-4S binding protein [Geobacteraceae bacterium GWC2_48_7]|nr:MAG: 4Fe-4S binding protein [Geobacteraceae bacterium GWC2_48_7]